MFKLEDNEHDKAVSTRVNPEGSVPYLTEKLLNSVTKKEAGQVTLEMSEDDFKEILSSFGDLVIHRKKWAEIRLTFDALVDYMKEIHQAFLDADSEAEGFRAVKKMLGWRYKPPVDRDRLFWEYLKLIRGDYDIDTLEHIEPIPKKEAIERIMRKYEFASYNAAFKQIQRAIKQRKDKFGADLKGMLPGNWQGD